MEVHHHPDLHHKKKEWKEYLLEFLMIFLAVTLGFFAETFREHLSEKHREKEYIVGLLNNIQKDGTVLSGLISRNDDEIKGIDSLLRISKTNFRNIPVQDSIFFYAVKYTITLHLFEFNDLTLVQLRNAGGYSLISTGAVADSIALYESKNKDIKLQEKFVTDYYAVVWTSFKNSFDGTMFDRFYPSYESTNQIPSNMPVLISTDPEKMYLVFNNYWTYTIALNGYNRLLKEHQEYLNGLAKFLRTSYHLP